MVEMDRGQGWKWGGREDHEVLTGKRGKKAVHDSTEEFEQF